MLLLLCLLAETLHTIVQMLKWSSVKDLFPPDVIKRAQEYMDAIPGGTGAYSESQGASICREQVAKVSFHHW